MTMQAAAISNASALSAPPWVPRDIAAAYLLVLAASGPAPAAALVEKVKSGANGPWTPARLTTLVSMWAGGATSLKIASAIEAGVSRNAVIGKLQRLGLTDGLRATAPRRDTKAPSLRVAPSPDLRRAAAPPTPAPPPLRTPAREHPRPIIRDEVLVAPLNDGPVEGLGIFDLETHHCRWPLSGEKLGIRYCGARRVEAAFYWYCERHQSVAAAPSTGRRRA